MTKNKTYKTQNLYILLAFLLIKYDKILSKTKTFITISQRK